MFYSLFTIYHCFPVHLATRLSIFFLPCMLLKINNLEDLEDRMFLLQNITYIITFYITVYAASENYNLCHITCTCCVTEFPKTQYEIALFYSLEHKIEKRKKPTVAYRLKFNKNYKDSPLKKERRGNAKKKPLPVHFIKFSKPKPLRLLPQVSLNPKVILETLKSHLFESKGTVFKNCRARTRWVHRLRTFLKLREQLDTGRIDAIKDFLRALN